MSAWKEFDKASEIRMSVSVDIWRHGSRGAALLWADNGRAGVDTGT